jgi:hypothetical protein
MTGVVVLLIVAAPLAALFLFRRRPRTPPNLRSAFDRHAGGDHA